MSERAYESGAATAVPASAEKSLRATGSWRGCEADFVPAEEALANFGNPVFAVRRSDAIAFTNSGEAVLGEEPGAGALPLAAYAPALRPSELGDAGFRRDHRLRFALMSGAMANGIGSCEIVEAMARAGMLGSFGAAGLGLERIETAIRRLQASLGALPYSINLIHSPHEPLTEAGTVELLLRHGVRLIEASAFLDLTLPLVRYRVRGIRREADGQIVAPNRVIAKVSRVEVAAKFFAPPPEKMLAELVKTGELSPEQAQWARQVPLAQDLTAEADSGGHTDNRPAIALIPTMLALRERMQAEHRYAEPLRVGAAGGMATPASLCAVLAMGAAYVATGSVNQACVESGSSDAVRTMLAQAAQADVIMAPAADMFEMGVKVQVLKRGTMFAMRAQRLYELYRAHESLEAIPPAERAQLEKDLFRVSLDEVWRQTQTYFGQRDPRQLERAARDARHRMALVFRWYLGQSSRWANNGTPDRQLDYQIWCGPAMGAFNEWTKGSFMAQPAERRVAEVNLNLLCGAAASLRAAMLRAQGVAGLVEVWRPRRLDEIGV